VIPIERVTAFLKRIHLFSGLSDDQLGMVAAQFTDENYKAGAIVFNEGAQGDTFYLIFNGQVTVFQKRKKNNKEAEKALAVLVAGDYFGEEALLTNRRRSASIRVEEDALLLSLSHTKFVTLLKKIPQLKPNFQISVDSRKLSRQLQFKWVRSDEVIYFLARKHIILLLQVIWKPALLLVFPIALLFGFLLYNSLILLGAAILVTLVVAGILVWDWVDWGNDYYIVTNQRVVWLEKVVGLYDSRQESPLSSVLSVGTETEALGRSFDYGNVVIRTFVGRLVFHHVAHPYQAAALVQEHWSRAKESSRRMEVDTMKQVLSKRMNPTPPAPPPFQSDAKKKKSSEAREGLFANFFKVRFEDKEIITYRKHWFVLLQQIWLPTLLTIGLVVVLVLAVLDLFGPTASQNTLVGLERDTFLIAWPLTLIIVLGWWIYQYVDWSNDIYQVTPDQIFDIDRKPLGSEQKTAAQLESILATEYERRGILGLFFNYGTVHITVGGTKMAFEDVFDPPSVQQDIDRRRMARNAAKEEARVSAERNRLADWFMAYNEVTREVDKPKDQNAE
jgi:hypothetical protein